VRPLLLDTCAAIFIVTGQGLSAEAEGALSRSQAGEVATFMSPITAWEIGMLTARGRLRLAAPPAQWYRAILARGVREADLSAEILTASSDLPSCGLRDPADRILAATARANNYTLVTRDRPLLAYAEAGHIRALAC
jgi:PIN domain nuclease of toxin-antitoxin system